MRKRWLPSLTRSPRNRKKRVESIKELQTKLQEGVEVKLTAHTKNTKAVKEPVEELEEKAEPGAK